MKNLISVIRFKVVKKNEREKKIDSLLRDMANIMNLRTWLLHSEIEVDWKRYNELRDDFLSEMREYSNCRFYKLFEERYINVDYNTRILGGWDFW